MNLKKTKVKSRNFCAMSGKEYLFKLLALYYSLEKHSSNFRLWICCLDDITLGILSKMNLKHAVIFPLKDVEDQELLGVKGNRKLNEYCWTLKAPLIQHVLRQDDVTSVVYCDSDIYFFSDPEPIFTEWQDSSVYLCPQRDQDWAHNMYGFFQAGLIGFRNDVTGNSALKWWREKCIEWCYSQSEPENGRFGDQKYLDKIPSMFSDVKISTNLGIDSAPWNSIYNNSFNIYTSGTDVIIEKDKLVAFHFACITIFNASEFDLWTFDKLYMSSLMKNKIYIPYLESIRKVIDIIASQGIANIDSLFSNKNPNEAKTYFKYSPFRVFEAQYDELYNFCCIVSNEYLIRSLALYYSLKKRIKNFTIWLCCTDDAAYSALTKMNLENMIVFHVNEIDDPELKSIKSKRSLTEFCWTLKAPLVLHLLNKVGMNSIIYCDADIYFFTDPKPVFDEWKNHSFFMCRQRDDYEFEKVHGSYQAGFLGFRNDKGSLDILNWWRKKCIDWCYITPEPQLERWGDQKYLDKIPLLFGSIKLVNHLGIDAAPWNLIINNNFKITSKENEIYIENYRLVVYHFGSMLIFNEKEFDLWKLNTIAFTDSIINAIYVPYLRDLAEAIKVLKTVTGVNIDDFYSNISIRNAKNYYRLIENNK